MTQSLVWIYEEEYTLKNIVKLLATDPIHSEQHSVKLTSEKKHVSENVFLVHYAVFKYQYSLPTLQADHQKSSIMMLQDLKHLHQALQVLQIYFSINVCNDTCSSLKELCTK